ncbi:MAG: Pr2TM family membrane protein [Croceitalea sp.]|nr:Pr2TM family membrane protein [Croceitalea sp.]
MSRFLRELIKAVAIGTAIFIVLMAYFYVTNALPDDFTTADFVREYFESLVFATILYMVNAYWFFYLLKKFNYNIFSAKRLLFGISGNIIISLVGIFVARTLIAVVFNQQDFWAFIIDEKPGYYRQSLIIAVGISLIFYAIWYYKYKQDTKVKEQKIIAGTASARFDALKNQLDPHFLFNSLNVLTSLIEEDPDQAQKFTTSLSKVYRYVLEQKNKDLVTLDEELNFARTYVRLLKMRFEDSIVFEIPDQASHPDAKIVPLSLQLLLENAVKHNVVTATKPLHIKVFEQGQNLVVSNNLQAKQVVKKSSGVGLQNIRQRYGILTDKQIFITKSEKDFSVSLPLLSKQVSVMETQEAHIEEKRYLKAKERVEAIKGFYGNLTAYMIVIPFLWWLNFRTTDFLWAIFPTLGWGFGLTAHGMEAFGYNPLWGKRWEEKKIRELMDKEDF